MSKKSFIDSVEVGKPCSENWSEMNGNERVRFCAHCSKHVNNLSEMTRKEAVRFVRMSGQDICIRYIADPVTRRPVFAEQLLQITRRTPRLAAGVMTMSISLSSTSYAQSAQPSGSVEQPSAIVESKKTEKSHKEASEPSQSRHAITGTVTDVLGALIPNASVIYSTQNGSGGTVANEEGDFRIDDLEPGTYRIEISSPGFRTSIQEVVVTNAEETDAETSLDVGEINEVVEVRSDVQLDVGAVGGVIVTVEYTSPLSRAIADEDIEAVRDLIMKGANVNAKEETYSNITPLFVAVENGNVEIVRILLDFGAKVNRRDGSKQTPLMRLDQDATPELVELLMRYGAKMNLVDDEGDTALIIAARSASTAVIQALIDAGADVNVANKEGVTALMNAAEKGEVESVRLLLFAGAKVNERDEDGDNARDYADGNDVEKLLESFGSEVHEKEGREMEHLVKTWNRCSGTHINPC